MGPDKKGRSVYVIPDKAQLDMISGYTERVIWNWESPAIFEGRPDVGLSKLHMEQHINGQL